ncbi:MAG: prolyl oligopeptidase family serine peptidase, partial [Gemmatimonadota bacterium]|nr:prolyl oligopeptidase family serine peptidase [Gemmatimonadota bacterium]
MPRSGTFSSTTLALLLLAACGPPGPQGPETRRDPVVDTLHGHVFVDDYRWLEDQDSPETRAWIQAQNEFTEAVVGETPERAWFRARLASYLDRPDVSAVRRAGEYEYFTMRRPGEEMPVLYRRPVAEGAGGGSTDAEDPGDDSPTVDGEYEVVLDPRDLDPSYRTPVEAVDYSSDGAVLAYSVRQGGADEVEIRFRDLTAGVDLPDRLPRALYGGIEFTEDGSGVYYTHRSRTVGPRIRLHRLGTPLDQDLEVWGEGFGPTTFISMERLGDGTFWLFSAQHGWAESDLYLREGEGPIEAILVGSGAHFQTRYRDGRVWVRTDWDAPNYRLMSFDPAEPQPENWVEVIPESDQLLDSYTFVEDRVFVTYLQDVENRIVVFDGSGVLVDSVSAPSGSSLSLRAGDDEGRVELTAVSHLQPSVTWDVDIISGDRTIEEPPEIEFDASGYQVDKVWYESGHGRAAPIYVVRREDIVLDGSHPTILNGYGGFNVSIKPGFSTTAVTWVEAGGIYATATLRGGSEYGEAWHRDGMLTNKQHVFEDFIAAAERLVELGYTSSDHLGISGGSNGGLLVASAMTQRPDLYRAVLCTYPDLDMVRFWAFSETNNMPALLEYG